MAKVGITFPMYKQCDPKWGPDKMGIPGGVDSTICRGGCAMSSLAMALAGYNVTIKGDTITPRTLNDWLMRNKGYHCISGICFNLVLDAPNRIAPTKVKSLGEPLTPFMESLVKLVESGFTVLAHVRHQGHFVLVTGFRKPNLFVVQDPDFDKTTYTYEEIHDILLYDIRK